MKVLFLTSRFPFPPYRGDKLKIFNLIKKVSLRHKVTLVSFVTDDKERQLVPELLKYVEKVVAVKLSGVQSLFRCTVGVLSGKPFQVSYYYSGLMKRKLMETIEETRPDVIHTHLIRMAPYTQDITSIPRILDLTDAVSLYLERFRKAESNPVMRWALGIELKRMVRFEPILHNFDRVLVCSDLDRGTLLNHAPRAKIDILKNGVDTDLFALGRDDNYNKERIIFTGNMSYFPNVDGAEFFVKSVLPIVKGKFPHAKFYIVGQNPPRRIRKLATDDVVVTGFVPDIAKEYLDSAVAVSPIRFGAGTLNKALEPLALGVPVVATSISVEGLELKKGIEIFVADGAPEFANQVVRVLGDETIRRNMRTSVTERIRRDYSWIAVGARLEQLYSELVGGR